MKTTFNLKRKTKNPIQRWQKCQGFSLMEVLVSVLVLAIGLLGIAAMQGISMQGNHSAYMRTQASYLGYEIIDIMRANRDLAVGGSYNINYGATVSGSGIASVDMGAWRNRIAALLPQGDSAIVQNGDVFTVSVRWNDTRTNTVAEHQELAIEVQL
ncbi:MAG: type IV pilus modification protein PilV [Gammaproteobacteria bacterium]|nr:type IV pilus modification protein PilV [Gammaproteobacteria bacterium]